MRFRVLSRAEDVEIAQAHGYQAVHVSKDAGIKLANVLGHAIRRYRRRHIIDSRFGSAGVPP